MSEESLNTRRFQFRIADLLLVTVVVALTVTAAQEGQINGTAYSPILLVVLASLLGAVTGRLVSDAFRFGFVGGIVLGVLDLEGTSVTDASVKHIASFPRLMVLDVSETDVTADGVKRLQSKIGRVVSSN